jgi:2-keto-4-pentenoate hydratase/2-oxohepta-3-ene-1,7-dioic acid hydratase in catechol pathway
MAYAKHLEEMGVPIPRHPVGFIKSSHAVIGPGAPIVLPQEFPDMVDLEGEFAFVLGRACHRVGAGEALDYVAGYTIVNDVSARNWVEEFLASKDPFFNILGKQLPTFCPMGPALVTPEEVPDPHGLDLTTTLNGEVMQSANTRDLLFTVADLIAFYSRWYAFQPGDVITTGSPPGVGYGRDPKVFMKPGDVVSVTIDRLGTLSNAVVAG